MTVIKQSLSFRIIEGGDASGTVDVTYDPARPLIVSMDFGDGSVWQIWRSILAGRTVGSPMPVTGDQREGGVACTTSGTEAHLSLGGPRSNGTPRLVVILLAAPELRKFLARTAKLVPYGQERTNLDAELEQLLGGAR